MNENPEYDFEVRGEVIKMIHDELPAVRWTCQCGEDSCTIFYDREASETVAECDYCHRSARIHRQY